MLAKSPGTKSTKNTGIMNIAAQGAQQKQQQKAMDPFPVSNSYAGIMKNCQIRAQGNSVTIENPIDAYSPTECVSNVVIFSQ